MVEADKARRLLGTLRDGLADLHRYAGQVSRRQLATDRDAQHMVLHAFYVTIQAALDLAMHLGADARLPQAATYQDSFRRLVDAGVLDRELSERLAAWAGFRNVLAHLYAATDYDRVYDSLAEVGDLERFADIVDERIDAESK
jgi:uncharacterized protein YutE (UPF0331/DUF86 family)